MLLHMNFRSWCLHTNTDVEVILPAIKEQEDAHEYYLSGKKYPVLWLLHGSYGGYNDYLRRTNIELYATENDLIVVMPTALNSEYSNWPDFSLGYNMFDFLTEELMPLIFGWLPASSKREENFICGLSMGSMGAAKYAVNHPNLFAGCSCMSGAPLNIRKVYNDTDNSFNNRFKKDVELAGGLEAYLNSYENVWDKCQDIAKMENPPKFYFCIGKEDGLYPSYMEFKKYAQEIGFKAAWEELDGYAHEWRFWELEIQRTLQFFGFTKTHTTPSNVNFKPVEKEEKEQTEKIDDPDKKIDAWSL